MLRTYDSRRPHSHQCLPEQLETRTLLSNVTVSVTNGDLLVSGDSDDNHFEIDTVLDKSGRELIWFEGKGGTTVNNSWQFDLPAAELGDDIRISFSAGGRNRVVIKDLQIPDDLIVKGGRGSDGLALQGSHVVGDTVFKSGKGHDVFVMGTSSTSGDVRLSMSNGRDLVAMGAGFVEGDFIANTGRGADEIAILDFTFENDFSLATSSGSDAYFASGILADHHGVNLGSGDDQIAVADSELESANWNGGSGADIWQASQLLMPNGLPTFRNFEDFGLAQVQDDINNIVIRSFLEFREPELEL